ncbi:MAG: hypothetical protein PUF74_07725 [Sodaliphilus pleomorphus]|jgi:uncharacterized membrane protein YkvA (DUF1232 family)|uniref:hypothetical protein n=1 Tax=Sodaliphilus pleomorphus TaxID=2606626 RepID=UPI002409A36F|nr:hypothetical protein [Sodaliphilus pleomorphus]MDD6475393.1 hypothetical protein [Sodaliphilus pleomorphus]MDY6251336.1 hypothetical protein [Bacteroidales bacterium]
MMQPISFNDGDASGHMPPKASPLLKACRVISTLLLVAATGYIVMPYDFDSMGWLGYVDDFFLFMAAFTFFNGSFQKAARRTMRRQLYMIALLFFVMAVVWVLVLNTLEAN